MSDEKPKNYTINFTEEDRVQLYTNSIVEWWLDDAHPEIRIRAEKLARELICEEEEVAQEGD